MTEPTFGQWVADHFYWLLFVPIIYYWAKACIFGIKLHNEDPMFDNSPKGDDVYYWMDGYYNAHYWDGDSHG
jgi:hypothetical protein